MGHHSWEIQILATAWKESGVTIDNRIGETETVGINRGTVDGIINKRASSGDSGTGLPMPATPNTVGL